MSAGYWIYAFGTLDGKLIKLGKTKGGLGARRHQHETGQLSGRVPMRLLVAVRGESTHEQRLMDYFDRWRVNRDGGNSEVFHPSPELAEYINWLRHEWYATLTEAEPREDVEDWRGWCPTPERRVPPPPPDEARLFNTRHSFTGDLAGTPWSWMATPDKAGQDYYTPKEVVETARLAMGGIDLDPATHADANRVHKIKTWYHINRSAFENPWFGRVWLNPPYGDNSRWFNRIMEERGFIEQLCMISPVWAFSTQVAREFMAVSSAMVLLSPTPKFWGKGERTGTNHPHAVVYLGPDKERFLAAFAPDGSSNIPMSITRREAA